MPLPLRLHACSPSNESAEALCSQARISSALQPHPSGASLSRCGPWSLQRGGASPPSSPMGAGEAARVGARAHVALAGPRQRPRAGPVDGGQGPGGSGWGCGVGWAGGILRRPPLCLCLYSLHGVGPALRRRGQGMLGGGSGWVEEGWSAGVRTARFLRETCQAFSEVAVLRIGAHLSTASEHLPGCTRYCRLNICEGKTQGTLAAVDTLLWIRRSSTHCPQLPLPPSAADRSCHRKTGAGGSTRADNDKCSKLFVLVRRAQAPTSRARARAQRCSDVSCACAPPRRWTCARTGTPHIYLPAPGALAGRPHLGRHRAEAGMSSSSSAAGDDSGPPEAREPY